MNLLSGVSLLALLNLHIKLIIRVVTYCVILKMAVNIKDLYGNSGRGFKKINTR